MSDDPIIAQRERRFRLTLHFWVACALLTGFLLGVGLCNTTFG